MVLCVLYRGARLRQFTTIAHSSNHILFRATTAGHSRCFLCSARWKGAFFGRLARCPGARPRKVPSRTLDGAPRWPAARKRHGPVSPHRDARPDMPSHQSRVLAHSALAADLPARRDAPRPPSSARPPATRRADLERRAARVHHHVLAQRRIADGVGAGVTQCGGGDEASHGADVGDDSKETKCGSEEEYMYTCCDNFAAPSFYSCFCSQFSDHGNVKRNFFRARRDEKKRYETRERQDKTIRAIKQNKAQP